MIKAAFFDIDGTLVSFKTHKMSDATIDSLKALQAKGIKVCISSGRPKFLINNLGDYPFDAYVCCNGAIVYCDGKVVFRAPVDRQDAINVVKACNDNGITLLCFPEDGPHMNFHTAKSDEFQRILNLDYPEPSDILHIAENEDIYELSAFVTLDEEKKLFHPVTRNCTFPRWHPDLVDINPAGMHKFVGAQALLKAYGISGDEVIAFGDGGNDIDIIRDAGIGVAMGNAVDEVKAAADYVTASVDDEGITLALRHFGLLQ